jgi:hypothetical protein
MTTCPLGENADISARHGDCASARRVGRASAGRGGSAGGGGGSAGGHAAGRGSGRTSSRGCGRRLPRNAPDARARARRGRAATSPPDFFGNTIPPYPNDIDAVFATQQHAAAMNQQSSGRPYAQDLENHVQDSEAAFALGMLAGLVQQSRSQPELLEQTQMKPD